MFKINQFLFYLFIAITLTGCSDPKENEKKSALKTDNETNLIKVAVVNYPLQYFVEQIGQSDVDVFFPVKDGDPAYWKPDNQDIRTYQSADIIFLNGANYAKWINYASLPDDKLINTSESFTKRYILIQDEVKHNHGPKGNHSHGTFAFTTWLDIQQAIQQADKILDTLIKLKPSQKEYYKKNYHELVSNLKTVDEQFKIVENNLSDTPVIFSHPVYQYFQKAYSINGISVHWEPDTIPDDEALRKLSKKNLSHSARWMIWENTPLPETKKRLQAINIESVVFNPASIKPEQGDFITIMLANIHELKKIN